MPPMCAQTKEAALLERRSVARPGQMDGRQWGRRPGHSNDSKIGVLGHVELPADDVMIDKAHHSTDTDKSQHNRQPAKQVPARTSGQVSVVMQQAPLEHSAGAAIAVQRQNHATGQLPSERQYFINQCTAATNWVAAESHLAEAFVESTASNYADAHSIYTKTISSQIASDKLADDALLDAALTFLPGGGVKGVLGAAMGQSEGFIISGFKEIVKTNSEKVFKGALSGDLSQQLGLSSASTPLGKEPHQFRKDAINQVHETSAKIHTMLSKWIEEANKPDSKGDFGFNPMALVQAQYRVGGVPAGSKVEPTSALQIEKGMWKRHVTTKTSTEEEHFRRDPYSGERNERLGPGAGVHSGGFKIGAKIRKRIVALATQMGEDGEAWISDWGGEMHRRFTLGNWAGETEEWSPDQWSLF